MRTRWIAAAALVMAAAFPSNVQAGDGWRVVDTVGVVRAGGPGFMPIALTREQELPQDAWIETKSGRAVLVRGHETVIVEPNSRLQLPGAPVNGNTQVLQSVGSAIYKIGKQKQPHFQVDTPYMAAVVKGTAFTVSVDDDEASVTVTEGLVEVSTPDMKDVEFVRPGFTALVSRDNSSEIVIDRTRDAGSTDTPPASKADGGSTQAVMIPKAIGEVEVDVKEVSSGLVASDDVRVDRDPVKGGSDVKDGKDGSADDLGIKPKDDVVALDDKGGPGDGGPKDNGPKLDGPADIIVIGDTPVDGAVDDIRAPGKGNSGNALGALKGRGPT
jgi:hypothetical protein